MNKKRVAGDKAAQWVENGMNVGLGTGSTVYYTIQRLGERVKQGLQIRAIPTSRATEQLATSLGIPLMTFADVTRLDVAIDGADSVTPRYDLIKGGGGALLREKLVAESADKFIVVVDDSKQVSNLTDCSVPVEIVPFAFETTIKRIRALGAQPILRTNGGQSFVTDNGNYIADVTFGDVDDASRLHYELKTITGVVETGLFVGMADIVVVGTDVGPNVLLCGRNCGAAENPVQ